jgi:cytidylate kinase
MLSDRDMNGKSTQDYLWEIQRQVIIELAEKESCVIVGRCADYILKDKADCLKVFIHSDMDKRAERIVKQYGESADKPEKRLKDKDARRRAYYQFYTGEKWGDIKNYHITLNSGVLGIDKCVEILTNLYQ